MCSAQPEEGDRAGCCSAACGSRAFNVGLLGICAEMTKRGSRAVPLVPCACLVAACGSTKIRKKLEVTVTGVTSPRFMLFGYCGPVGNQGGLERQAEGALA